MHPMILEELRRKKSGGAAKTYATWNPADKGAGITLSNGNMTAEKTTTSYFQAGVRSTIAKNTGIHSAEFVLDAAPSQVRSFMGIGESVALFDYSYAGETLLAINYINAKYLYGASSGYPMWAPHAIGTSTGIVVDFDAGTAQYYINGVASTLITDSRLASNSFHLFFYTNVLQTMTLNTGATPFNYPLLPVDGWFE